MKRLVSLLLSCLLLSSCGTIVTPAKTPPEHLVSEAPPGSGSSPLPARCRSSSRTARRQAGRMLRSPPGRGRRNSVETLPEPQRVVDPTRPMVALTFDDGPHAVYTDQILDILEEHGAVATFFEVARNLPEAPEAVRRRRTWAARSAATLTATQTWARWIRPPSRRIRPRRTRCFRRCWAPRPRCCGRPMAP